MNIVKNITTPTGNILITRGRKGMLECLSLSDYGKAQNIKADFLGFREEINGVPHGELLPLTDKWVCTISTQYGCSMGCSFCDVPAVGKGMNATLADLQQQILTVLKLHPEVTSTKRFNVHFARMGEPTWNPNVLDCGKWLKQHVDPEYCVHPVVSTMMPKSNEWLRTFIHTCMRIKNRLYGGNAGLQLSINSTNETEREDMFSGNACSLLDIYKIMDGVVPVGRKITLNFALAGYEIDPEVLLRYFDPSFYIVKITPMHVTASCKKQGILTDGGYEKYSPYKGIEAALKSAGYDVLVFVPSKEEDESRITCGNAILAQL